ncbi:MAG TPA: phosphatase PAP2 family protein [Acidimicrobiales bacterium]|nr:phosphatase PAP2 family protein [Acidimicrobiales bacterium]
MDSIIRFVAGYFFIISIVVVALYWLRAKMSVKISLGWHLVVGGVLALVLARIAGHLYYDPRPFVTHHLVPLIAHAADNGFPSDHALLCSFLAFTMLLYSRRTALLLIIIALLVSWARVAAHLHNPRDIVGSFVFAAVAVIVVEGVSRIFQALRGTTRLR